MMICSSAYCHTHYFSDDQGVEEELSNLLIDISNDSPEP